MRGDASVVQLDVAQADKCISIAIAQRLRLFSQVHLRYLKRIDDLTDRSSLIVTTDMEAPRCSVGKRISHFQV